MAAEDRFPDYGPTSGLTTTSALRHITPVISDTETLSYVTRALRFGAAGDVCLVFRDDPADATGEVYTVSAGERLDARVRQIMATGTTLTESDIKCWD